ncbi:MAG TPA: helix-turn-helix transcriptional regulator [Methylocystis sp.]
MVNAEMMTPGQSRAARGLIGWSQTELGEASGLSLPTIKRFETERGANVSQDAVTKIRSALESAGVIFIDQNGEGPGVRLRKARVE